MIIEVDSGWLRGVRKVPSPNCDRRPAGAAPELIVVHGISLPPGEFDGRFIDELFINNLDPAAHPYFEKIASSRVSAHVLISRTGGLTQYVSFAERAWHAGESSYCGRRACNDYSVGIELEGTDDSPYERVQYERLAALVRELRRAYPTLEDAEIVGHSDIAPGRKTDPGAHFDWALLRQLASR
ncbi:MAG TPA: 1,6-anhydro-N-acetylmuramyl-L-alanine amidase AmpD [Gammaproteobacteria bacterium]|nr:1,6-anhydro-N-acetylmuramyl-L-alanine amidase AmpD [Gammaproteobacteria bacterium]